MILVWALEIVNASHPALRPINYAEPRGLVSPASGERREARGERRRTGVSAFPSDGRPIGLSIGGDAFGAQAPLARIDGDEHFAGPAIGRFVIPSSGRDGVAGDFDQPALLQARSSNPKLKPLTLF